MRKGWETRKRPAHESGKKALVEGMGKTTEPSGKSKRVQQQTQRDLQRAQGRAGWVSLGTKKRDSWKDGDVIAMESGGERDDMGLPFRESQE